MTTTILEQDLQFRFDDSWRTIKWDKDPVFHDLFKKVQFTHGVDFVALYFDAPYLIEVTDYWTDPARGREVRTNGELGIEVAEKVRDTIAALVWAYDRGHERARDMEAFVRAMIGWRDKVMIVVWVEDKSLTPMGARTLCDKIKKNLSWLNPHVIVTNCGLERMHPVPGISAVRLSQAGSS